VRSTHYTVIYDENSLAADVLQQGINTLSYLWARATKSVSYAPPAYWADKACDRARFFLKDTFTLGPRGKRMSPDAVWEFAKREWGQGVHSNVKDTMFYL